VFIGTYCKLLLASKQITIFIHLSLLRWSY